MKLTFIPPYLRRAGHRASVQSPLPHDRGPGLTGAINIDHRAGRCVLEGDDARSDVTRYCRRGSPRFSAKLAWRAHSWPRSRATGTLSQVHCAPPPAVLPVTLLRPFVGQSRSSRLRFGDQPAAPTLPIIVPHQTTRGLTCGHALHAVTPKP